MDDIKFAAHDETAFARPPRYYGVHHLALNTDDMKMTVDFYVGVLGMRLVHAMKVPPGVGTGPATVAIRRSRKSATISSTWGGTGCLPSSKFPKASSPRATAT